MRKKELKMLFGLFLLVCLLNFSDFLLWNITGNKNLLILSLSTLNGGYILLFVPIMLANIIQKIKFYKMLKRIDFETGKAFYNDNQCILFDLKKSKVAILYYSRGSNRSYPIYNIIKFNEIKNLSLWEDNVKKGFINLAFNFPHKNGVEDGVVFCKKYKKNSAHSEITNNDLEFKSIISLYDYMMCLVG